MKLGILDLLPGARILAVIGEYEFERRDERQVIETTLVEISPARDFVKLKHARGYEGWMPTHWVNVVQLLPSRSGEGGTG